MIWIIAGTSDSHKLIEALKKNLESELIATTATDYGKKIIEDKYGIKSVSRRMEKKEMVDFIEEYQIKYLLDAGHPFAEKLSLNAISAAAETGTVYLRYERERLSLSAYPDKLLIKVKDYLEAAAEADKFQRIFLTTGSKTADIFIDNISNFKERLFFRILPSEKFVGRLIKQGVSPAHIAALQGPFSRELNKVLFKEFKADVVISKASGSRGGLKTKIEAALELKIPIIIIERPEIDYPNRFENISSLVEYIKEN